MTSFFASALVDDPRGCALLGQVIDAEGGTGRPALIDPDVMIDALARLRGPAADRREVYDCLVRAFVVDLDVLGEVIDHALPVRRAAEASAPSARNIRAAARAASRRLRPLLRPLAA